MSEDPKHGTTTIRGSKGGGGGKWLLGALAAVVLVGGGYAAWQTLKPNQANDQVAINNAYDDDLRAGPLESDSDTLAADVASDEPIAAPASSEARTAARPRRTTTASASEVPEETIGITPANYTAEQGDDIVVTAGRRPVWARTPSERRLSALYPARALERGREGEARLSCTVQDGGALDCVRIEETPGGFGPAAVRVARTYRHASTLSDGSDATGTPVNLRVVFRIADEDRRSRG